MLDQLVKVKQEAYEKLDEMSRNDDYTPGNLLHYLYHQKHYKHIGTDLSRELNTSIYLQINDVEKPEENDDETYFYGWKATKTLF